MTESQRRGHCDRLLARKRLFNLLLALCALLSGQVVGVAAPWSSDVAVEIFGEEFLSENVLDVRQQVASLPDAEAFALLSDWVLPGALHLSFRPGGEFTPVNVAENGLTEVDGSGWTLVSPVVDLMDVAVRTGRLKELRDRVALIPTMQDDLQSRSKTAPLMLLSLELNDLPAAGKYFDVLYEAVKNSDPVEMYEQWPETLVADRCVRKFPDFADVGDLLNLLMKQRVLKSRPKGADVWFSYWASLARKYQYRQTLRRAAGLPGSIQSDQPVTDLISVTRERGKSRGRGIPLSTWSWDGAACRHIVGHDEDYLLFRSPLRGNFQVEADLQAPGSVHVLTAGTLFGPRNKFELVTGNFRTGPVIQKVDPPFTKDNPWIRYRATVHDGVVKTWLHGRLVDEKYVSPDFDPWVGIRSWGRSSGVFRDLRITGSPTIPASVEISSPACANGWYAYHEDSVGEVGSSARWMLSGEATDESGIQISGWRRTSTAGSYEESLLRYFRPLIENGAIEYEFFYKPGELHVHPAFGRLAIMLEPDGARLHRITDGKYDRTSLSPDNLFEANEQGIAVRPLPLKADEWNRMRLSIVDWSLVVALNDEPILALNLEATNSRHFGLFHFSGRTGVRVRRVVMRGDWPRELPPVASQQLADGLPQKLDGDLKKFGPAFNYDFGHEGLAEEFFSTGGSSSGQFQSGANGLTHIQRGEGKYTQSQISVAFRMHRDLDVAAAFDDLVLPSSKNSSCELILNCEGGYQISIRRQWQETDPHRVVVTWVFPAKPGTEAANAGAVSRSYENFPTEILGGRFRIARRGDTVHVLVAEYDSDEFRVLTSRTIETIGERPAEILLRVVANESATTSVTWKRLRLSADELFVLPDLVNPPKGLLYVMNADGTELRQLTKPIPMAEGMSHGSPDWSPNGDLIAFDVWSGRVETSHSFTIKADGTGLKDLGVAAMPTFSPDGKRLAFTWVFNGQATMDLEGADRKVITPDGWGAQWSPDGKWIAYESRGRVDGRFASNVAIVDLKSKETKELLKGEQASRYSQIYWNMEWSPDSQQIVFKGRLIDGTFETCITSLDGSDKEFRVLTTDSVDTDFGWHPDGTSILMSKHSAAHSGKRLFVYDLSAGNFSLLETQPMDQINTYGVWSPDGKQILFNSRRLPEPILWKPSQIY